MNRRDFLRAASTGAVVWSAGTRYSLLSSQDETLPVGTIPADKGLTPSDFAALRARGERRVWRGPERFALGMPIGGIWAGQLYLLGTARWEGGTSTVGGTPPATAPATINRTSRRENSCSGS